MSIAHPCDVQIGERLGGRYLVLHELGCGPRGGTYVARDLVEGTEVQLKVVEHPNLHGVLDRVRRIASVDHPNLVPIHAAVLSQLGERGAVVIASRYVRATPLRRLLDMEGNLEPARALKIAEAIASALAAAHAVGVSHGHVRTGNVFVDTNDNDRVWINHFGLSPDLSPDHDRVSLGTLLHDMLTGWRARLDDLPRHLAWLIQRATSLDAETSFATMEELRSALVTARAAMGPVRPLADTVRRQRVGAVRRGPSLLSSFLPGALAVIVLFAGAAAMLAGPWNDQSPTSVQLAQE